MKQYLTLVWLIIGLSPTCAIGQLNNGGLYSLFGVDADTRTNYLKYGIVTGSVTSDDWFAPSGAGNNVIDTSNAAFYKALLQSGNNASFSQRMSQLLYARVNGKLWLDAAYGRDYTAASTAKDSTVFTIAAKNGDDPNNWQGGVASTPAKNDLIDVYAHMRRDGLNIHDSLWFFTGIVAFGNAANSYYDVELYKKAFGFNPSTNSFSSAGTSGGHTEWLFDAAGNITQTGDVIVAVSFFPGSVPTIDVRIWVSQTTYNTWHGGSSAPTYFNFGGAFSSTSGTYGYASIVSKAGTTAFGAGIANYSGTPAQDTTYATPWGSSSSSAGYESVYQSEQLIEVGLNLTRIGIDPALYATLNPCQSFFSEIFFASRSSASFSANLQDFVTPLTFLRQPVMDFAVQGDTLRCNHPTGTITLTDKSTAGYYSWQSIGSGNISGANSDSSQLSITKPGTYVVSASPAEGCPTSQVDTIVVPIDTFPPVATAFAGAGGPNIYLYGGNAAASNYPTPFGGSQGLTWNWSGPQNFSSSQQNPVTDTAWGTYNLTVTEKRNGCTATASVPVLAAMFTTLQTDALQLEGHYTGQDVDLAWKDAVVRPGADYIVERSNGQGGFEPIGDVVASLSDSTDERATFSFTDNHPMDGNDLYRIKLQSADGSIFYSPTLAIGTGASSLRSVYLAANGSQPPTLVVQSAQDRVGTIIEYDISGRILARRDTPFQSGTNTITLREMPKGRVTVVALFSGDKLVWCQKAFY
ncbi:MAG TPA: hypothetical protein VKQ52_09760 [Puia sp.]|nr:hypothetical protein [Puia sp.]